MNDDDKKKLQTAALVGVGVGAAIATPIVLEKLASIRRQYEKKANYRAVTVGGKTIDLDTEIPLITDLPSSSADLRAALESHIQKAKSTRWSHPQIAIPASVDLTKLKDAAETRLAIPLPGESIGAKSLRSGRMHSHTRGPVHLLHLDEHAPTGSPIAALKHVPEAVRSLIARRSAEPFVKSAAEKLRVLYIDETGGGHRAQTKNVVSAARKMGIDAEAVNFTDHFIKNKDAGKEYHNAYSAALRTPGARSAARLGAAHLRYYSNVDRKKLKKYIDSRPDDKLLLAHQHLEGLFMGEKRPISVLYTDPVKWPAQMKLPSAGTRRYIGTEGSGASTRVTGLAVSPSLLKKRLKKSGLIDKKKMSITVSGGAEGAEVPQMLAQVLKADLPANAEIHAVAGRNKKVLSTIEKMSRKDKRIRPHGFAPLGSMMREADLNVVRAHGTTYAETLTSGKPAVYYGPRAGITDVQGVLTRRTAVHGGKETSYPVAEGLAEIPKAVNEAQRNYKGLRRQAQKLQKGYGDPAAQIALAAVKEARAPRDYKQEYAQYHGKPEQVGNRSLRNQARRKLGLKKGDPREVDHKTPLSKGGSNSKNNLRSVSFKTNREKFNG
jgi:hypothetical protein